jgi:hypothetical protein
MQHVSVILDGGMMVKNVEHASYPVLNVYLLLYVQIVITTILVYGLKEPSVLNVIIHVLCVGVI